MNQYAKSTIQEQYVNMMRVKNWTPATQKTYLSLLNKFLSEVSNPRKLTTEEIIKYIASQPSRSYMAQMYGVLKNLYFHIFKQKRKFGFIPFPKQKGKVNIDVPHEEVLAMINEPSNIKHRLILNILYGTGIRVGELCNARWNHLIRTGGKNPIILFIDGKNRQRKVPLSSGLYDLLIEYCREYNLRCDSSNDYILGGKKKYSAHSVQNICNKYCGMSPHKLRHLYAQWQVDNGTQLDTLRQLLGHNSLASVEIYARTKEDKIPTPV